MESNWKFHHVGVIVWDMDKAVKYYQTLGIFTFLNEETLDSSKFSEFEVYGKPPSTVLRYKVRFALLGPQGIELISPTSGNTIYDDYLEKHGEGIQHFCFKVYDLDAEMAKLRDKNIPIIMYGKRDGIGFAYYDTGKIGSTIIELAQRRLNDVPPTAVSTSL